MGGTLYIGPRLGGGPGRSFEVSILVVKECPVAELATLARYLRNLNSSSVASSGYSVLI